MSLGSFFSTVGHDVKVAMEAIGHAFAAVFIKLFGLQETRDFVNAAEALLKTDFGKALLALAEQMAAGLAAGTPLIALLEPLAVAIIKEAEAAGIAIAEDLAKLLATLVLNKLNGNFAATTAAAQAQTP